MHRPELAEGDDVVNEVTGEVIDWAPVLDLISDNRAALDLVIEIRAGRVLYPISDYLERPASLVRALEIFDEYVEDRRKQEEDRRKKEQKQAWRKK